MQNNDEHCRACEHLIQPEGLLSFEHRFWRFSFERSVCFGAGFVHFSLQALDVFFGSLWSVIRRKRNPLTGFDRQRCPERDDGDKGDFQHWVSSLCIQGRLKGCHCGSLT